MRKVLMNAILPDIESINKNYLCSEYKSLKKTPKINKN